MIKQQNEMYHQLLSLLAKGTRLIAREHVSDAKGLVLNQNVWSIYSSSFCVEHDEASAMYANITLAVFVFCFHAATSTL